MAEIVDVFLNKEKGRVSIGGFKGVLETHVPSRSNFFHFHAVFSKILRNNRYAAQTQRLAPSVWEILGPPPESFYIFPDLNSSGSRR